MANGVLDQDLVVPVMTKLQKRFAGKIERASFDRAFHTPDNQEKLAKLVLHPCIPKKGEALGRQQQEEATVEFRQARQHHPGVEWRSVHCSQATAKSMPRQEQTRLRTLRGPGHLGPQPASIGRAVAGSRGRCLPGGQVQTQKASCVEGRSMCLATAAAKKRGRACRLPTDSRAGHWGRQSGRRRGQTND